MRSLFDQYDSQENRLTHALACCLAEDHEMLRRFVKWSAGISPPAKKRLFIVEQTLPGEEEQPESNSRERSLPDAWIHDNDTWSLIIESKINMAVQADQLRRHKQMAQRRGFDNATLLVISIDTPSESSLTGASHRKWSDVYEWFHKQRGKSLWATKMVEYMEVLEAQMTNSEQLATGTLTRFSGVTFDQDTPYSYREAKRLLRLMMDELRKNKRLEKLGVDPSSTGRKAITGSNKHSVWDFLSLKASSDAKSFTNYPHLTLSLNTTDISATVVVPNGVRTEFKNNIKVRGKEAFADMIRGMAADLLKSLESVKGATPWMEVVQRHYLSQRSAPTVDARLEFDLRTAMCVEAKEDLDKPVKTNERWVNTLYDAWLSKEGSNIQIAVGAKLPYSANAVQSREALTHIADTWLACEPFLKALLGK